MAAITPSVEPAFTPLLPDFWFWPDLSLLDCLSLSDGSLSDLLSPFGGTTTCAEDDAGVEFCAAAGVLVLAAVVWLFAAGVVDAAAEAFAAGAAG